MSPLSKTTMQAQASEGVGMGEEANCTQALGISSVSMPTNPTFLGGGRKLQNPERIHAGTRDSAQTVTQAQDQIVDPEARMQQCHPLSYLPQLIPRIKTIDKQAYLNSQHTQISTHLVSKNTASHDHMGKQLISPSPPTIHYQLYFNYW